MRPKLDIQRRLSKESSHILQVSVSSHLAKNLALRTWYWPWYLKWPASYSLRWKVYWSSKVNPDRTRYTFPPPFGWRYWKLRLMALHETGLHHTGVVFVREVQHSSIQVPPFSSFQPVLKDYKYSRSRKSSIVSITGVSCCI